MGLKEKFQKFKYYISGSPIKGEQYKDPPNVKDLPHMKDADGQLIAVSSGKRELSPALSANLNIQSSGGHKHVKESDDTIEGVMAKA
ncbi:LAFA_0E00254g1_1 [Lachancea sp. 'fantastica']|nr:LAFA_0E00254g1_1 [Lachancea sp. 'fantastica']